MKELSQLADLICAELRMLGKNQKWLARKLRVHPGTLSRALHSGGLLNLAWYEVGAEKERQQKGIKKVDP
jgi:hypothetical protein